MVRSPRDTHPAFTDPPALSGAARIGQEIGVTFRLAPGAPAAAPHYQWFRNGQPIAGATAAHYTPTPDDDRCELGCRVSLSTDTGPVSAATAPVGASYAPPVAVAEVFDEIFDAFTGVQYLDAVGAFEGEDLHYAITGRNVSIDPVTGRIAVSTANPIGYEEVVIAATNSGGTARQLFFLTVEAEVDYGLFLVPFEEPEDVRYLRLETPEDTSLSWAPRPDSDTAPKVEDEALRLALIGSGHARFNLHTKARKRPRLSFDALIPAGARYRIGMVLGPSDKTMGRPRFEFGTPENPQAYGKGYGGNKKPAVILQGEGETGQTAQTVRFTFLVNSVAGAIWPIDAIFVELLDGDGAVEFIEHGTEAKPIVTAPGTYYIAYETGHDGNDGRSPETPFKSVPLGLQPGTTVILKGGERYRGAIRLSNSGQKGAPITLDMTGAQFGDGPAILDGGRQQLGWRDQGGGIWASDWPEGFDLADGPLFQDGVRMGIAQLPTPSSFTNPYEWDDWALADAITPSSVTAPGFFAGFRSPETLPDGARIRVRQAGGSGYARDYAITAFDPKTGTVHFDAADKFAPFDRADRWNFAIYNHPDCLTAEGEYYRSADGKQLLLRPFGGASPNDVRVEYLHLKTPISVSGSHVEIRGGIIERSSGKAGILLSGSADNKVIGTEVRDGSYGRAGIMLVRQTRTEIRDCYAHHIAAGRGIWGTGCVDSALLRNRTEYNNKTNLSLYGARNCLAIGNRVGKADGVHANGFSCTAGPRGCTIAFNDIRASSVSFTMQNSTGANTVVFNTFLSDGGHAMGLWRPWLRHGIPEHGQHILANNVALLDTGQGWAVNVQSLNQTSDALVVNNIADGIGTIADQRFDTRQTFYDYEIVADGTGYQAKKDVVSVAGRAQKPALARLLAYPPKRKRDFSLRFGGAYDQLPPDLDRVEFRHEKPGKEKGLTLKMKARPLAPRHFTANMITDRRNNWGPDYPALLRQGNFDGRRLRAGLFRDVTSEDIRSWDLRPSGRFDLSNGFGYRLHIDHPLLPGFPKQGIAVSHIGRYLPDGRDIWDWSGSMD